MAKLLLGGLFGLLLLVGSVSAVTVYDTYDESYDAVECSNEVNVSQWEAAHACALTYDADWGTYGAAEGGNISIVYFNYTKPTSTVGAVWEHKGGVGGAINSTIPAACFANPTRLRLYVVSADSGAVNYRCWNTTAWIAAGLQVLDDKIYEEAIYWGYTVVNGACGTGTKNSCSAGTFVDIADTGTLYQWTCVGLHSGTTATCSGAKTVDTLTQVGQGVGGFLDNVGNPLASFLIIVGLAGGVVAIFVSVGHVLRRD